jgi:WD40 repeat protein
MDLSILRQRLRDRYDRNEFRILCLDLQSRLDRTPSGPPLRVAFDDLGGDGLGLEVLMGALLERLRAHQRIPILLDLIREQRPDVLASLDDDAGATAIASPAGAAVVACPYPGMQAFTDDQTFPFFGRTAEIRDAVAMLWQGRFLAVVGRTGSGKSSLVLAGVVPELRRTSADAGGLACVVLRPGADGLAGLREGVRTLATASAAGERTLLVIDQFEEVFRHDQETVRAFAAAMADIVNDGQHAVILTARADFYPDLMELSIWPLIRNHRLEVLPLAGDRLREALREPAVARGVTLDPVLLERIVTAAAAEPGSLPLVQVMMQQLWAYREGNRIPVTPYDELGGLTAAVARTANDAYRDLARGWTTDAERTRGQAIVRRIFVRLVDMGRDGRDSRRQQSAAALRGGEDPETFTRVLTHFIDHRLLTSSSAPNLAGTSGIGGVAGGAERDDDRDGDGDRRIDLAHDSLITAWPTLRDWLTEVREVERRLRKLARKAEDWGDAEKAGEPRRGLLDRFELAEADQYIASGTALDLGPGPDVGRLVDASRRELQQQDAEVEAGRARELQLVRERQEAAEREADAQRRVAEEQGRVADVQHRAVQLVQASVAASRRTNRTLKTLGLVIGAALWIAAYGWYQHKLASEFHQAGVAQTLAAQALTRAAEDDIDQGMLLARQAWLIDKESGGKARFLVHEALNATIGAPGRLRRLPLGADGNIEAMAVAFGPDDDKLAVGGDNGAIYLLDWRKPGTWLGALTQEAAKVAGTVLGLGFSVDGHSLVALTEDHAYWLRFDGDRLVVQRAVSHAPWLEAFGRFSVHGRVTAGNSTATLIWNGRVSIFSAAGGDLRELRIDMPKRGTILDAALSPDERTVAVATTRGIAIVDVASGQTQWLAQTPYGDCAFSPDGMALFAASLDFQNPGTLRRWNRIGAAWAMDRDIAGDEVENHQNVQNFLFRTGPAGQVWFESTAGGASMRLRTAAAAGPIEVTVMPRSNWHALSATGEMIAGVNAGQLMLWEIGSRAAGTRLYADYDGISSLSWSGGALQMVSSSHAESWPLDALFPSSFSLDSKVGPVRVWTRSSSLRVLGVVGLLDYDSPLKQGAGTTILRWTDGGIYRRLLDVSGDGDVVVSCEDRTKPLVRTIKDAALARTEALPLDQQRCSAAAISADGQVVAIATEDGKIIVWRRHNDRFDRENLTMTVLGESAPVVTPVSLHFDAKGNQLAAGYEDGRVLLWEFGTITVGPSRVSDPEFQGSVMAVSPDGHWLATGGPHGTMRLWDLTNRSVRPPVLRTGSTSAISAIAFSDDGTWVFVGDQSGKVHRWLTNADKLADLVCERAWRNLSMTEWRQYVGEDVPYACTCPALPPGENAPASACAAQ